MHQIALAIVRAIATTGRTRTSKNTDYCPNCTLKRVIVSRAYKLQRRRGHVTAKIQVRQWFVTNYSNITCISWLHYAYYIEEFYYFSLDLNFARLALFSFWSLYCMLIITVGAPARGCYQKLLGKDRQMLWRALLGAAGPSSTDMVDVNMM